MAAAALDARPRPAATERVVALMTPAEKERLETKARHAGVSVGQYVRQAVEAYEPDLDETAALELMVRLLEQSNVETDKALERAERALDEVLAYFDAKRSGHGNR
jgi:hypothetical protein